MMLGDRINKMFDRYSRIIIRQTDGLFVLDTGSYEFTILKFSFSFSFSFSFTSSLQFRWQIISRFFFSDHFVSQHRSGSQAQAAKNQKQFFYSARQWYLQRAMGCEEKRKGREGKGKQETRDEKNLENSGWLGSASKYRTAETISRWEAKNSRFFFSILFVTSLLPFFCHSLFLFFYIFLRNVARPPPNST